jgi:diadenosine tetraphosphatase ApaH/serine/threonine PP2A family protein phosphatase
MRYAIISDLHANMQAWKAVYEDIQKNNVDRIICLGDTLGYGPNPAQLIREVRNNVDAVLLGNHDAALCGKLDVTLFNDDAQRLLEWTRKQLSKDDLKYIASLPLTLIGDGFLCAHAEFSKPENFDYASEAEEVMPSWKATTANLLFVGHTHVPSIHVLGSSGIPRLVEPQDFTIDAGKRYFINVGSVGQSRDNDLRSCYCIYESESQAVYWRRVNFDVEAYRKAMRATGLKLDPSYYLPEPVKGETAHTPANWHVEFSPPKTPGQATHDVVSVQDLKDIPKLKKKLPLSMISLAVFIVLVIGAMVWRYLPHVADIEAASATPLPASSRNSLSLPDRAIKSGEPIPGWNIHMENKNNQQVGVNLDPFKQPFLYFKSKKATKGLSLSSSWISVQPGQNWTFDASLQKKKDFTGTAVLMLTLQKRDGTIVPEFANLQIPPPQPSGLSKIQQSFIIPEGAMMIRLVLQGNFSGTLLILKPKLFTPEGTEIETSTPDTAAINSPSPSPIRATRETPAAKPANPNDPWSMKAK